MLTITWAPGLSAGNLPNVGETLFWSPKKMGYRSVMPNVVDLRVQFDFDDITDKPMHLLRSGTYSLFRAIDFKFPVTRRVPHMRNEMNKKSSTLD